MKKFSGNKIYLPLLIAAACFVVAAGIDGVLNSWRQDYVRLTATAQEKLHQLERETERFTEKFSALLSDKNYIHLLTEGFIRNKTDFNENGFYFLVFNQDTLKTWSDNRVAFDEVDASWLGNGQLIKLRNGWYEVFVKSTAGKTVAGLLLIKNEYAYQNRYLKNDFNDLFQLPYTAEIVPKETQGAAKFFSYKGEHSFSVMIPEGAVKKRSSTFTTALYILAFCLLCYFFHLLGRSLAENSSESWKLWAFILIIAGARIATVYFKFPEVLYDKPMFGPQLYASSIYLGSLGDFLINAVICYYLVSLLTLRWRPYSLLEKIRGRPLIFSSLVISGITFIFLSGAWINYLLHSLIINSSLSFSVSNVFSLSAYNLYSFIIISLLLFSFYLLVYAFGKFMHYFNPSALQILFPAAAGLIFFCGIYFLFRDGEYFSIYDTATFSGTVFLLLAVEYIRTRPRVSYANFFLVVSLVSIYASTEIFHYNRIKEQNSRLLMARKLDKEQDLIAEYLFEDIGKKLSTDKAFADHFSHGENAGELIVKRLHQFYFTGYWGKYDFRVYGFDSTGNGWFNKDQDKSTLSYFESIIKEQGKPTFDENLFFLYSTSGRTSYLARLPVPDFDNKGKILGTLIIELESKFIQEDSGFPELLLSDRVAFNRDVTNYSYAKYSDGVLVNQYGSFPFYLYESSFGSFKGEHRFLDRDGFNHLLYRVGDSSLIALSKTRENWFDFVTLFSYMFALLSLFLFILFLFGQMPTPVAEFRFSFKNRIRLAMTMIVLLSLALIGGGTIFYITSKYNTKQYDEIGKRISTLLITVERELETRSLIENGIGDELSLSFTKLANSVAIDFSIYNLQGSLLFTSQPKIYEQGIAAKKMNTEAFYEVKLFNRTRFVQNENTGRLSYISAYEPIRNGQGKIIGYLGIPYFSKESELKKEISSLLITLINIYVLLFALSLTAAFVISNRITEPLRVIQEKLGQTRLGTKNELIEWKNKDEIGELVNEYNRMVDELSRSAELLAKSERETAWREMAKQVAHEIKNPLTPMKLSVQHLQKAWKDKSPHMDEIVQRISKTLIEQIDALSSIATEFSHFAKMPRAKNEAADLYEILSNVVSLYKETTGITINLKPGTLNSKPQAFADREQLLRVFNNLVKNSIQAIPEGKEGEINISITIENEYHVISITDNGTGISHDQRDKIFVPNFTTKTGGMGLGLAMVKSIVENAGGKVWFESREGEGTTFFVSLPQHKAGLE